MKNHFIILFLSSFTLLTGCRIEPLDPVTTFDVVVINNHTGAPIPNQKFELVTEFTGWGFSNTEFDTRGVLDSFFTDSQGKFSGSFEQAKSTDYYLECETCRENSICFNKYDDGIRIKEGRANSLEFVLTPMLPLLTVEIDQEIDSLVFANLWVSYDEGGCAQLVDENNKSLFFPSFTNQDTSLQVLVIPNKEAEISLRLHHQKNGETELTELKKSQFIGEERITVKF